MDTQLLLDKLVRAISFKYKDDKTAPGVTVSVLKNGYYCSIVRYNGAFAKDKVVVCSCRGASLQEVLEGAAHKFLDTIKVKPDPLQDLNAFIGNCNES